MTVYHGGLSAIPVPRIIKGDRVGDFGMGFYTTTDLEQARRFVMRKCIVEGTVSGVILFEDGQIGYEELIRRLKSRRLVDQLLFHTEKSLSFLRSTTSMEVVCPEK